MPDHLSAEQALARARGRLDAGAVMHLARCGGCRAEVRAWRRTGSALRSAFGKASEAPPDLSPLDLAFARLGVDAPPPPARRPMGARLTGGVALVRCQMSMARRGLAAGAVLMLLLGLVAALLSTRGGVAQQLVVLVAPLITALTVGITGGRDIEIVQATPTSARLVLLARMVPVIGIGIVLALAVSVVPAVGSAIAWGSVVLGWLGPLLTMSALALTVTLIAGESTGIAVVLAVWGVRAFAGLPTASTVFSSDQLAPLWAVWNTGLITLVVAAALFTVALLIAPRANQPRAEAAR